MFRWYPPAAHAKFGSGWTGPYLVTRKISDLVYQIQGSKRSKPKVVHLDHLKPYYSNDDEVLVNWLEEPTGAEEPEGLLESPEDGARGLLTESEEEPEIEPEVPMYDGYGIEDSKEDSDERVEQESSKESNDAGAASELGSLTQPPLHTHGKRTIRPPKRFLQAIKSNSPQLGSWFSFPRW